MRDAGVLEDYLKNVNHDPVKKYRFSEDYVVNESITNHLDVSTLGPSCCLSIHHAPLSLLLPCCWSDLFTLSLQEGEILLFSTLF